MSNSKISALTSATTPLAGTEVLPIVQSSTTKKVSVANLTVGRTQISDGIVQGSAATGYNFTANTPAAGMTSQLLNWYEQGTWTATDTSGAGLSLTTANAFYTRIGRQVTVSAQISYPANASALAASIGGLPFAANASGNFSGSIENNAGLGAAYLLFGGSTSLLVKQSISILSALSNANLSTALLLFTATYIV